VQTYERMNVADALQTRYYEDGEAIINQVSIVVLKESKVYVDLYSDLYIRRNYL